MAQKGLLIFLNVLLGAIFIFSAITKLYPIETFEFTFVDLGLFNWSVAPFVARLMIGFEFLIGALLVLNLNLKKYTYKLSMGMLLFFSLYLILLIVIVGNKGNCGCFGSVIEMTPLQALIKNVIMFALLFVLNKQYTGWQVSNKLINSLFILSGFVLPFILNPIQLDYSEAYLNKPENNYLIELDSLYANARINIPPKSLSNGKQVIVFMSLTCPHCKIAAKKIRIIHERNPNIPFYFVLNGKDHKLKPFYEETHTENIPFSMLGAKTFIALAGLSLPQIYLVNNSIVENSVSYFTLNQTELENWLNINK
jgi:hypothetical protein